LNIIKKKHYKASSAQSVRKIKHKIVMKMVESGKRKRSPPSSPSLTMLPASASLLNVNNSKSGVNTTMKTSNQNEIKKFKKTSTPDTTESNVDTYESLYNDPITEDMGAHEKFVFNLGLDLALDYSLESFDSMIKSKQEESTLSNNNESKSKVDPAIVDSLPFNVENKYEFFNDLNKNRVIVRKRTKSFRFTLKDCIMCNFRTESDLVMDTHLSEPHNMSTLR
jgi:hypothetical protein